jgi:hypothetical protein
LSSLCLDLLFPQATPTVTLSSPYVLTAKLAFLLAELAVAPPISKLLHGLRRVIRIELVLLFARAVLEEGSQSKVDFVILVNLRLVHFLERTGGVRDK